MQPRKLFSMLREAWIVGEMQPLGIVWQLGDLVGLLVRGQVAVGGTRSALHQ